MPAVLVEGIDAVSKFEKQGFGRRAKLIVIGMERWFRILQACPPWDYGGIYEYEPRKFMGIPVQVDYKDLDKFEVRG